MTPAERLLLRYIDELREDVHKLRVALLGVTRERDQARAELQRLKQQREDTFGELLRRAGP